MTFLRSAILLVFLLSGCTNVCTDAGIEGTYELASEGRNYTLRLKPGVEGSIAVEEKAAGGFRWTLTNTAEQQILELDASDDVLRTLSEVTATARRSSGTLAASKGVLGPSPECNRAGRLKRLVFSYDEGLEFTRVGEQR